MFVLANMYQGMYVCMYVCLLTEHFTIFKNYIHAGRTKSNDKFNKKIINIKHLLIQTHRLVREILAGIRFVSWGIYIT